MYCMHTGVAHSRRQRLVFKIARPTANLASPTTDLTALVHGGRKVCSFELSGAVFWKLDGLCSAAVAQLQAEAGESYTCMTTCDSLQQWVHTLIQECRTMASRKYTLLSKARHILHSTVAGVEQQWPPVPSHEIFYLPTMIDILTKVNLPHGDQHASSNAG